MTSTGSSKCKGPEAVLSTAARGTETACVEFMSKGKVGSGSQGVQGLGLVPSMLAFVKENVCKRNRDLG